MRIISGPPKALRCGERSVYCEEIDESCRNWRVASFDTRREPGQLGSMAGASSSPHLAAPFSLTRVAEAQLPVVIAVPHAGQDYPAALLTEMRRPAESCLRLEDRLADRIAAAVAEE